MLIKKIKIKKSYSYSDTAKKIKTIICKIKSEDKSKNMSNLLEASKKGETN